MSAINENTDKLLEQIISCDLSTSAGTDKAKEFIRRAIKIQDRNTRHACAEAVLSCNKDISGECVWKDEAHRACMNVIAL